MRGTRKTCFDLFAACVEAKREVPTLLEGPKWQNTALTVDGTKVLGEHGKNHPAHLFNDGEHSKARQSLAAMKAGSISGSFERRTELTFYTSMGWLTPWVALGTLLVWTTLLFFGSRRPAAAVL